METEPKDFENYVRAKKSVDNIKNFYAHLVIYLFMNSLLLAFKGSILNFFRSKGVEDEGFLYWMEWNLIFIPILWGIVLLVTGLYFLKLKPRFFRDWEDRQIKKYMKE